MFKAIFFDKENTLLKDNGYDPVFDSNLIFEDFLSIIDFLKDKDFRYFIITNQSGINRGFFSKEIFEENMNKIINYFKSKGLFFNDFFYCPHLPEENCDCRKPKMLLVKRAEALYNLDLKNSYIIGDRKSDVLLGINAKMKTIYLNRGYPELQKNKVRFDNKNDYNLDEDFLIKNNVIKIDNLLKLKEIIK